jgi:hypothetical protein
VAIEGPNGGKRACRFNFNRKKCVNNQNFEDNEASEPEPEPEVEQTECAAFTSLRECRKATGPNGGSGACNYNTNKGRCVTNKLFKDNEPATSPPAVTGTTTTVTGTTTTVTGTTTTTVATTQPAEMQVDCTKLTRAGQCRKATGPNGGTDFCIYNVLRQRCVTNKKFVDNGAQSSSCASAETPRICRKMLGPNGGEDACLYNTNKRKCVDNPSFKDNSP